MPAQSQAQFRAMQAAAHGKSTLGIPAKVGKEFVSGQSPKGLPERKSSKDLHKQIRSKMRKAFPKG